MPDNGAPDGLVRLKQLVEEASGRLDVALGGNRRQEALWLVERVSGYSSAELVLNEDEPVSIKSMAFFDTLLARRESGEPLQYVLGRWQFRQCELLVDARVLIPRPETEWVAQPAIEHLLRVSQRRNPNRATALDLGTGSGAVACSFAVEVVSCEVWATDVSGDALSVAGANVAGLGRAGSRVSLAQGSWFGALNDSLRGTFDAVFSNPPYVDDDEALPEEVSQWEPHLALFGGVDGSDHLRTIISEASQWLAPGGFLVLEMAPKQTEPMAELARAFGMRAEIRTDLTGRARSICCWTPD